MTLRRIVAGTLGLVLALVWAMAFLYQRSNVAFLMAVAIADAPLAVRASSLWSVLQIWTTALLALPVALMSIAAMCGGRSVIRVLRITVVVSAVVSAGVLLFYAGFAVPSVVSGRPGLLANPRIHYEVLVALATLGLQLALLALWRRADGHDGDVAVDSGISNQGDKAKEAVQPFSPAGDKRGWLPDRG
jgi:hypothetical protein